MGIIEVHFFLLFAGLYIVEYIIEEMQRIYEEGIYMYSKYAVKVVPLIFNEAFLRVLSVHGSSHSQLSLTFV